MKKIHIIKGAYDKFAIRDTVFPLIAPVRMSAGKTFAQVDASELLGKDFKNISIELNSYKEL
jgi:hypothetical protein